MKTKALSNKYGFAKKVLGVIGTKGFIYIWSSISSVFFARILGPQNKGVLAIVISIYSVGIQFANLGIHSASIYYISKDKKNINYALGNAMLLVFLSVLGSAVGLFFCIHLKLFNLSNTLLIISFLMIPIGLFNLMQKNIMVAADYIKQFNVTEIIDNMLVFFMALIASAFIKITVINVAMLSLVAAAVVTVYSIFVISKLRCRPVISIKSFKEYFVFGIQAYLSCLTTWLVLKADIFMLDYYMDDYSVGIYSLAVSIGEIVFMISNSVSLILFPHLGTLAGTEQKKNFIAETYKVMVPLLLAIVTAIFIVAKKFIVLLYGEEYYDSATLLRLLLPGIFFWALSQFFYSFFSAENNLKMTIVVPSIGFIINFLLNYFLIPAMGTHGAAIASSIAYGFCFAGMLFAYKRYLSTKQII